MLASRPDYMISTHRGCVPHITDLNSHAYFKKHYLVYADDFLFASGYYARKDVADINTFLQILHPIAIVFRSNARPSRKGKRRQLATPQGNRFITKDEYDGFIETAKPAMFADFETGDIGRNVERPPTLEKALDLLRKGCVVDTQFVTELTQSGFFIDVGESTRSVHIDEYEFGCSCCAEHSAAYIRYLWSINEIISMNVLQHHNFCQLQSIVRDIEKAKETVA